MRRKRSSVTLILRFIVFPAVSSIRDHDSIDEEDRLREFTPNSNSQQEPMHRKGKTPCQAVIRTRWGGGKVHVPYGDWGDQLCFERRKTLPPVQDAWLVAQVKSGVARVVVHCSHVTRHTLSSCERGAS